jgi:hypothetical protein
MDPKSMSISELRKYCVEQGLNFADVLINGLPKPVEAIVKEPPKKRVKKVVESVKPQRSAEDVVLSTLDMVRDAYGGETISLSEFTVFLESELKREGATYNENCSIEGFSANVLYEYSESVKFGTAPARRKRLVDPVTADELAKLLRVDFGKEDNNRIAGTLSRSVVEDQYPLNEEGRLANERGSYNIEGTKNWDGENKEKVRQFLVDSVLKNIVAERQREREQRLEELEAEKDDLSSRVAKTRPQKPSLKVKFESGNPSIAYAVRIQFIKGLMGGKGEEGWLRQHGAEVSDSDNKSFYIEFAKETDRDEFLKRWKKFGNTRRDIYNHSTMDVVRPRSQSGNIGLESRLIDVKNEISEINEEGIRLNYLGLEGPNFESYLRLFNALNQEGVKLSAVIPEYVHRFANLMRSVSRYSKPEAFEDVAIPNRNIDDLILLDFASDSKLGIDSQEGRFFVTYGDERISLEKYHELIDTMDQGGPTIKHLESVYGISAEFIAAAKKRPDKKFDVVFLDYLSGVSEKRKMAQRILLQKRLAEKAVVLTTSNLNPRMNHDLMVQDIPGYHLDNVLEIAEATNCDVGDFDDGTYKDGKTTMHYHGFVIQRREKD